MSQVPPPEGRSTPERGVVSVVAVCAPRSAAMAWGPAMRGKRELGARVWIAAVAAVRAALPVAVFGGVAASAASSSNASGLITVGAEEFPPTLNNFSSAGNGQWTGMIVGPALARGYKLMPDFSYEPWLFDKDCA